MTFTIVASNIMWKTTRIIHLSKGELKLYEHKRHSINTQMQIVEPDGRDVVYIRISFRLLPLTE